MLAPLLASIFLSSAALAAEPFQLPEVAGYREAWRHAQSAARAQSLEPLLARAREVQNALLPVLDDLSAESFARLQKELAGMALARGERPVVRADAQAFLALARSKGTPEDVAFFELYHRSLPDGSPAYRRAITDYSGCTEFGGGKLTRLYGEWKRFGQQHSGYRTEREGILGALVHELTDGTCACEEKKDVRAELERFAREFPSEPATAAVRARLRKLEAGDDRMRFRCVPTR